MKKTAFIERRILNMDSAFKEKRLCDGPTFSAGDSCRYSCAFCYAFPLMEMAKGNKELIAEAGVKNLREIVVRRNNAVSKIRSQLLDNKGNPKYLDPKDRRVIYASPLVDVAAGMELVEETVAICREILTLTHWDIRLLSKSNLLPKVAQKLEADPVSFSQEARSRVIYGVSTGTANNGIAKCFEKGTPLVSKRVESLRWLQDNGFRTFGMICPSLPRPNHDYQEFSKDVCDLIRIDRCEHVWAEVINVRGDSLTATAAGLREGGYDPIAEALEEVSHDQNAWEEYNRETFLGHKAVIPPEKLRYLTYVRPKTLDWWKAEEPFGAVLLGKAAHTTPKISENLADPDGQEI